MKVIEVRVCDEHDIHWRQVAQPQPRTPKALQNEEPAGKIGIDDDVHSADLEEKSCVSNKGHA